MQILSKVAEGDRNERREPDRDVVVQDEEADQVDRLSVFDLFVVSDNDYIDVSFQHS